MMRPRKFQYVAALIQETTALTAIICLPIHRASHQMLLKLTCIECKCTNPTAILMVLLKAVLVVILLDTGPFGEDVRTQAMTLCYHIDE